MWPLISPHLTCTVTGHIDDARMVFPRQWQKTSGEVHGAEQIGVDLILDDGIRLPFEFTEAHDARVVHQIAEFQILVFAQQIYDRLLDVQNAGAFADIQFHQLESLRVALVEQFLGALGVRVQTGGAHIHVQLQIAIQGHVESAKPDNRNHSAVEARMETLRATHPSPESQPVIRIRLRASTFFCRFRCTTEYSTAAPIAVKPIYLVIFTKLPSNSK